MYDVTKDVKEMGGILGQNNRNLDLGWPVVASRMWALRLIVLRP